jgi:ribosomal-protein-serine acetyltransferase
VNFIRSIDIQWRAGTGMQMGVWSNDALAGMCGFHLFDARQRAATMAYWLGLEAEGRGLMKCCATALVEWALSSARLRKIEIHCAIENRRSRALASRLGFLENRRVAAAERINGRVVDHVVYARHAP